MTKPIKREDIAGKRIWGCGVVGGRSHLATHMTYDGWNRKFSSLCGLNMRFAAVEDSPDNRCLNCHILDEFK